MSPGLVLFKGRIAPFQKNGQALGLFSRGHSGRTEVDEGERSGGVTEDVVRADVPVNHSQFVDFPQRVHQGFHNGEGAAFSKGPVSLYKGACMHSLNIVHDQIAGAVGKEEIPDIDDPRELLKACKGSGLVGEP